MVVPGLPHITDFFVQAAGFQSQIRFVNFFWYIKFDKLSALRCDLEAHADTQSFTKKAAHQGHGGP